jgi:hypothetical protein
MRKRPHTRTREVPENTTEDGMKRLMVSGFAADGKKKWRVVSRTPIGRIAPYELKANWSYELVEYAQTVPESYRVVSSHGEHALRRPQRRP